MSKRESQNLNEDGNSKTSQQRKLRHKILYQWGILVTVGVFSFLYWFLLIPLVAPKLPTKNWAIIGPVAFFIWLIIVLPFIWFWSYKQKTLISLRVPLKEKSDFPSYPTKTSTVQPDQEAKHSPCSRSQDSSVWIPVQPGNVTPSLYNAHTGRDSFQSDYRLDEMPEKSSAEESQPITRNNSGVQLVKKFDSENHTSGSHRLISVSSSSSSSSSSTSPYSSSSAVDFKKIQRDPGDGLDAGESEEKSICEVSESDALKGTTHAVIEDQKTQLVRDESFKGLPDLQNFGEYLHLVTVDTPLSPRDAFFSDLTQSEPRNDDIELQRRYRKSYHPSGDLIDVQRRITEARKSLPPMFHYPDLEIGEPRVLKTTTLPPQTVLRMEDEQPIRPQYMRSISEGHKRGRETAAAKPKTSGEFFVADVARLESITSEVQMSIQPEVSQTCHISRWETKQSSIAVSPSSVENSPSSLEMTVNPGEGRWVILSRDYATNNVEAFIRIEQEAMNRERSEARLASEDTDTDSVFFELDQ